MNQTPLRLHEDPGLQPERTTLAWTRTAVSLSIMSMLWTRWSHLFGGAVFVMIALIMTAALAIGWTQRTRYRVSAMGLAQNRIRASTRGIFSLTAAILSFGIGSIALILSG